MRQAKGKDDVGTRRARKAKAAQDREARRSAAALATEVDRLTREFTRIQTLHRGEVLPARPPVAPANEVNERAIHARHRKDALAGIARSDRAHREAAKARAKAQAELEIAATAHRLAAEQEQEQARLDVAWAQLLNNKPDAVLGALRSSFENNETPATALAARGDQVALAVLAPDPTTVPSQRPVNTDGSSTELRTLSAAEHAAIYRELLCGQLLLALRQTFAAAPGLASAQVVVVRSSGADSYGRPTVDCLLAGRFTRHAFDGVRWSDTDASRILTDTSTDLLTSPGGKSPRLEPIDLAGRPSLAAFVARVDVEALTSPRPPAPTRARTHRHPGPARTATSRAAATWPDLGRARGAGAEWLGARSRAQRGALVGVLIFVLLGVVGTLADPDTSTTIDSGGQATSGSVTSTTAEQLSAPPTTAARVADGVPTGGDDTTVVRVIDGDTFEMAGGARVRLIGVDTPETVEPGTPVQCFGPEATRYTNEIIPPRTRVRLIYDVARTDGFGRTLAYVYKLDDGLFVNRAVARNGFALQYTVAPNVAHAEEFRLAVAQARDANLGLWRTCQSTTTAAPSTTALRATTTVQAPAAPTTRATVAAATPCTASVSNASPTRNATVTVYVSSEHPASAASATAHYKTTETTNRSTTDSAGAASIAFRISSATRGLPGRHRRDRGRDLALPDQLHPRRLTGGS
jgi:endonuclease YncB( thermonuclease family)